MVHAAAAAAEQAAAAPADRPAAIWHLFRPSLTFLNCKGCNPRKPSAFPALWTPAPRILHPWPHCRLAGAAAPDRLPKNCFQQFIQPLAPTLTKRNCEINDKFAPTRRLGDAALQQLGGGDPRAAGVLGALSAFRDEMRGLAGAGAKAADILAACDRRGSGGGRAGWGVGMSDGGSGGGVFFGECGWWAEVWQMSIAAAQASSMR